MASLGVELPAGIAAVSELIGRMEAQAAELDEMSPGAGDGVRFALGLIKVQRDVALAAQQSGDVVAMIAAYGQLKRAIDLATAEH